jgi:hypothetical protein
MRIALLPYAIRHTLYSLVAAAALSLLSAATPGEGATRIAILPFQNVSGHVQAPVLIMPLIAPALRDRGYDVVEPEALESFLAQRRIRATNKLSQEQLLALRGQFGAALALMGSIDLFADTAGNPQWGLSARIRDIMSGQIVWADAAGFTGDDFTGFLGLGTITSPEQLAVKTVQAVFRSLPPDGMMPEVTQPRRSGPGKASRWVFRSPRLDTDPPKRIAVFPFENGTERRGAALIVDDLITIGLVRAGRFQVEDPGEVYRGLQALGFVPYGGIDLETLRVIRDNFGVDAVIVGRVEDYNEGLRPGASASPSIALDARMLDVKTGEILWMGSHEARAEDSQIVLEFGTIKSIVPLGMKAIAKLVATM